MRCRAIARSPRGSGSSLSLNHHEIAPTFGYFTIGVLVTSSSRKHRLAHLHRDSHAALAPRPIAPAPRVGTAATFRLRTIVTGPGAMIATIALIELVGDSARLWHAEIR